MLGFHSWYHRARKAARQAVVTRMGSQAVCVCVYGGSGRQLLTLLNVPLRHDMYVIAAGCYSLWASCKAAAWVWRVTSSSNLAG